MEGFSFLSMLSETEEGGSKPKPPPLATHCDVPLKYNKQRSAILLPSPGQRVTRNNLYLREWKEIQRIVGYSIPDYYDLCHGQKSLLNDWEPPNREVAHLEFSQQSRVSEELWRMQRLALENVGNGHQTLPSYKLKGDEESQLYPFYLRKAFFEEGVLATGSSTYSSLSWWKKKNDIAYFKSQQVTFAASKNLCYIWVNGLQYLVSRDHLLVLSDLAAQRYILMKYALLSAHEKIPGFLPCGLLQEFFASGDSVIEKTGNAGYKILYSMEPYCLSFLIGDLPVGLREGKTFQALMTEEISKVSCDLQAEQETKGLMQVIQSAASKSPSWITELYGLYRIWGHPTVEPLEGTSALKKVVTAVRMTNKEQVDQITSKFMEEFIKRYIAKEHTWPDMDMSKLPVTNVISEAYSRKTAFPDKHKDYIRADLLLTSFNPLFPVDPKFDLIELIADKSLSLITPELISAVLENHNCGTATARSVLLAWLRSSIQDPEAFLKRIDEFGFPEVEKTVGVREKEREGKLKPRLFGLMTLYKRMYIVLTEALLAEHVIPFFPEITMIDDEISLDKKRYQFNRRFSTLDVIMISLDFSKWNSNMRKHETLPLFLLLDQMFGFNNCFARTHEMFDDSSFYLLNGSYLPEITPEGKLKENIGCWKGHLGGIEGLRQKGWTLWTVALILLAAEHLPFTLGLMGQGDNQVLRLKFPPAVQGVAAEDVMYRFLASLDRILGSTGPPLKLEETWASRDTFVYGKYIIYKGIPLPTSGKRVGRIFRLSNEDYPTLESSISSVSANLTAALSCNTKIGALFIIYLSELVGIFQLGIRSNYLQATPIQQVFSRQFMIRIPGEPSTRHPLPAIKSLSAGLTDDLAIGLCLHSRALGGFPVLTVFDCLLRGFPDEVTYSLASLKRIYPFASPTIQQTITRICSPPINAQKTFTLLFEHPTALNLEITSSPSEARRNLIIEFLCEKHIPINQYVSTFLDKLNSPQEERFIQYLALTRPLNPRVLSLFASATAEARARHVAGRLQRTRTISTVARTIGGKDLYSKIASSELQHIASVLRVLTIRHSNTIPWTPTSCSLEHAQNLRLLGWGTEIVGVDCVPPHEFMMLELRKRGTFCGEGCDLSKGHVSIRFDSSYGTDDFSSPLIAGAFPPYRGSVTRQKVSGFGDKIAAQAEPIVQKPFRIFSLVGWAIKEHGHLHQTAEAVLDGCTDYDAKNVTPHDEQGKGSAQHRMQDERTGHGGSVPVLPNLGTKMSFDTFPLIAYSKGSKNTNLMFQSFMSASVVILGEFIQEGWTPAFPVIHMHVASTCCVREISEEMCENPIPPIGFNFQTDVNNPYLFVPKERIEFLFSRGLRFLINPDLAKDPTSIFYRYHSMLSEEMFHLIRPHSWDRDEDSFHTQQLVINWMLVANTGLALNYLALRICGHYLSSIREMKVSKYLLRVSERVERSPTLNWIPLSAFIHAPDFSHHVVSPLVQGRVSGNPVCEATTIGSVLKHSICSIINHWAHNTANIQQLSAMEISGRPFCGLSQHPSLIMVTRDWITSQIPGELITDIRYAIINNLTHKSSSQSHPEVLHYSDHYYRLGVRAISNEDLDYLCKSPLLPKFSPPSIITAPRSLPSNAMSIVTFTSDDTCVTHWSPSPTDRSTVKPSFVLHLQKLIASPTGGTYKILSLLDHLPVANPRYVACLGDGGGGFALGVALKYPTARIFYNTLIRNEVPIQQAPPIPYIPAFAGRQELEKNIIGLDITTDFVSDLTAPTLVSLVYGRISSNFDLITCDAEVAHEDNIQKGQSLIGGVVTFAVTLNCPVVVFKTYLKNMSLFNYQVSQFLRHYERVSVMRSGFSSINNTEVYLVAMHLKASFPQKTVSSKVLEGRFLTQRSLIKVLKWKDNFLSGFTLMTQETAEEYSRFIRSDFDNQLMSELRGFLPYAAPGAKLIYPLSTCRWIQETSLKTVGTPGIHRVRLETSVLHPSYLRRWAFQLLLTYFLARPQYEYEQLEGFIETGFLIWFRHVERSWDVSLWFGEDPGFVASAMRVFSLRDLLGPGDRKILFRMLGIALHFSIQCNIVQSGIHLEVRGPIPLYPTSPIRTIEHPWVETHLISSLFVKKSDYNRNRRTKRV